MEAYAIIIIIRATDTNGPIRSLVNSFKSKFRIERDYLGPDQETEVRFLLKEDTSIRVFFYVGVSPSLPQDEQDKLKNVEQTPELTENVSWTWYGNPDIHTEAFMEAAQIKWASRKCEKYYVVNPSTDLPVKILPEFASF